MRKILLAAVALVAAVTSGYSQCATPDNRFWVPDGIVRGLAHHNNTIYLSGNFTNVGQLSSAIPLSLSTGRAVANFPSFDGNIQTISSDGNGGWYVGGQFSNVGGFSRNNVAHINSDYTVDPVWAPNVAGIVYAVVRIGNTVYIGGNYNSVNSTTRNNLCAVNASTGALTSFNPNVNEWVYSMIPNGTTLYIGGRFTNLLSTNRARLAAINTVTGTLTSWNPGADAGVESMAMAGNLIYASGSFTTLGGQSRKYAGAVDITTGVVNGFNPNPNNNGWVRRLLPLGNTVYAGGNFTSIGGQSRNFLAALDATTGNATSWNPNPNNSVWSLEATGGNLYVGGNFTSISSVTRARLAKYEIATGNILEGIAGANNQVTYLFHQDGILYTGGTFTLGSLVPRTRLAAMNATTGELLNWAPTANNLVENIHIGNGVLYLAGDFTQVNGTTRNYLASISLTDGSLNAWNPNPNNKVWDVTTNDAGLVYIGGQFVNINGTPRNHLAAIDPVTALPNSWNPIASSFVYTLEREGNSLFVGGDFVGLASQSRVRIGEFNINTGALTSFSANLNGSVFSILPHKNKVYVSGWSTSVNSESRVGTVAFDRTTGALLSWNPNSDARPNQGLALYQNKLFVGGVNFSIIGGQARTRLAALDTANATAGTWNPAPSAGPNEILVVGDRMYIGGDFGAISNTNRSFFAVYSLIDCPQPTITASGPLSFSNGGSVTLTAPAGFNYEWSNGATTRSITVTTPGQFAVRTNINGCTSVYSNFVTVSVTGGPQHVWNGIGTDLQNSYWSSGSVPDGSADSVVVASGTLYLTSNRIWKRLSVLAGARLVIGGVTVTSNELVRNNGIIQGDGGLTIASAANRIYGTGSTTIGTFTYSNSSFSVEQPVRVTSVLNCAGATRIHPTLGSITLASSASGQAVISPSSTGSFTNPSRFRVERYIAPQGISGAWQFVGPPVQDFEVDRLGDAGNAFAPATYDNGVPGGGSLYLYNPADNTWPVNNGYVKPSAPNQILTAAQGVRVWVKRSKMLASPLSFAGAPYMNQVSTLLQYCPGGCAWGNPNGFNLIKNPYVAWLNWDAASGWNRSGVSGQIHVWNASRGQFATYVGGVGVNGGSNLIAPGQAYFVEATGNGAFIEVDRAATTSSTSASFLRSGAVVSNVLKLQLAENGDVQDEAAIRFDVAATTSYDPATDARKMNGSGASIATVKAGATLAISTLPVVGVVNIPVSLTNAVAGQTISLEGVNDLAAEYTFAWVHPSFSQPVLATDQPLVLSNTTLTGLQLQVTRTVTSLHNNLSGSAFAMWPNPANDQLNLAVTGGNIQQVTILDVAGRVVLHQVFSADTKEARLSLQGLNAGTYVVKAITADGLKTEKLVVR